jgi:phage N-6-adenine-methyltransferase
MTTKLAKADGVQTLAVERARDMLAKCKTVDEAKEIRDQAAAVKVYLRTKDAGLEAQNDAAEIVITAERRMGRILAETERHTGGRPAATDEPKVQPATLAEMGISRNIAARARKLADIPDDEFEERLADARATERLTTSSVLGKKKSPGEQTMRTPRWLFDELSDLFGPYRLDAYASKENALCRKFYTAETDGNSQPWLDRTFANPEFDPMIIPMRKAVEEAELRGVNSTMVAPVGCSQEWFHKFAIRGTIWVPDRRINFDEPDGTPTTGADRDTIFVTFGEEYSNRNPARGIFQVRALTLKGPQNGNQR